MKQKLMQWWGVLCRKSLHCLCNGVSKDQNEVASRIRFLAEFRRPRAIVLGLVTLMMVGVGVFCLGGDNPVTSITQSTLQTTPQPEEVQGLVLGTVAQIAAECCPDFTLNIVTQDGAEYYRLNATERDVYLLVNAAQTQIALFVGEQSLQIPCVTVFGNATQSPATLALQDLTGDGSQEFVFLHEDGGTGALATAVHIVDLSTLTEYQLPDMVAGIAQQVSIEAIGVLATAEGQHYIQCAVSYQPEGQTAQQFIGMVQPFAQKMSEEEMQDVTNFAYDPAAQDGYWVSVALTEAGLQATAGLQITNQVPWEYVANATAMLVYNRNTASFVVGDLQSVQDSTLADIPVEYLAQGDL